MNHAELRDLVALLHRAGVRDVDTSSLTRALYSTDASLYRVLPSLVVRPRDADEVAAVISTAAFAGIPVTARGAGTSIAGNAVGSGVVLDLSHYLTEIGPVEAEARRVRVQPGVVHQRLQQTVAAHGLRFGPDPSSGSRCTVGGMIGNNACGSRALAYGRTSDNVVELDVVLADGTRTTLGRVLSSPAPLEDRLRSLVAANLATVRTQFGRFSRQSSGYALEHLLPERGFDLARAFVGSEGTWGVVTGATLRLVEAPKATALVVLGFPDMASAADAVMSLLPFEPSACEGMDSRIVDAVARRRGPSAVPSLPRGAGWLLVEIPGPTSEAALFVARHLAASVDCLDSMVLVDPAATAAVWRIREDGAGLSGVSPAGKQAHAGWEDSAVPPDVLGPYLRDLDALLADRDVTGIPYGHFGDGCVHIRLDFPIDRPGGQEVLGAFLADAAALVARYGGSMSGEHGDGRARSALLPVMYSPDAIALMAAVKGIFDPKDLLNPGILVRPAQPTDDLRLSRPAGQPFRLPVTLSHRTSDLVSAVHQCTGVGNCRSYAVGPGEVMCPSFVATKDEKDSTRGRARALQEMIDGRRISGGWRAPEVHEALDLCLSCKGCLTDCPTGIDMAAYKAEVLYRAFRRRLRPRAHYTVGWLPRWSRLAARAPRLSNTLLRSKLLHPLTRDLAGLDRRAPLPTFAPRSFRSSHPKGIEASRSDRPRAVLWVDTFTDRFAPDVAAATVRVLESAGYAVELSPSACCGLTWISTGQLDAARRILRRTTKTLLDAAQSGAVIVGIEPSCTAVLRAELTDLVPTADARTLSGAVRTLAEALAATTWTPPDLNGTTVVAQPHCHHSAILGWENDAALLAATGATLEQIGSCCGLAGNFGVEAGHRAVSEQIAANALLPALRSVEGAVPDCAVIVADGFSCRLQVASLTDQRAIHLAELLDPLRPAKANGLLK